MNRECRRLRRKLSAFSICAISPEGDRRARTSGHPTGNGAERPVDVRLAPTVAERRPSSGIAAR